MLNGRTISRGVYSWKSPQLTARRASTSSSAGLKSVLDRSDWQNESYQYLERSKVPSEKFQRSLPRLPIPKLEKTVERYLATQRPLLAPNTYEETAKAAKELLSPEGQAVHNELVATDKANKHTSYITGPWTDMYLRDRSPVAFTHNPGIMFAHDTRPFFGSDGVMRASNMLISSLRFHKSLKDSLLKPEVFHLKPAKTNTPTYWNRVGYMPEFLATPLSYLFMAFPLDMSQYVNLFQSTRLPQPEKDVIKRYPESKHILVMRRGHFYVFDVYNSAGELFEPNYYLESMKKIAADDVSAVPSSGIGVFTGSHRDLWTEMRAHLVDIGNEAALETIDSALYCICLDDWEHDEEKMIESVKHLVVGPDPANRWFDKSFSLIYSANGTVGINFEHAWGDGVAVMRLVDEIVVDSQQNAFVRDGFAHRYQGELTVRRIDVKTDERVRSEVKAANADYQRKLDAVAFGGFYYDGLGRGMCKRANISPDSLMQSAFQIAYHRLNSGQFVPTYESCSTSIYKHGRTETMRPGTMETKAVAEAFNARDKSSSADLLGLLQAASKQHTELTKLAAQGQGWDRHLFALRQLNPDLAVFQDPAYAHVNKNVVSTSTLASTNMISGGFCPVVPNGFGLGYQIQANRLGSYVSSFVDHTLPDGMVDALRSTFDDMKKVIEEAGSK